MEVVFCHTMEVMERPCQRSSVWLLAIAFVAASQLRSVWAQGGLQNLGGLDSLNGLTGSSGTMILHKRLFLSADCRGAYAPHFDGYLSRVHTICKECSDMYPGMRDFIVRNCTADCFRNRVFQDCISATMQVHQLEEISNMIGELSGRKK